MSTSMADVFDVAGSELRFVRGLLGEAGQDAWDRLLEWFIDDYFRLDVLGLENIPAEGAAVLVSNHSGAWGLDAFVFQKALTRALRRPMSVLAAPLVFRLPVLGVYATKKGAVPIDSRVGTERLNNGELVAVFPEGISGLEKPFRDRYQLQPFSAGFAVAAIRSGAPVIPVAIIGAEESSPKLGEMPTLARLLDLPYLPLTSPFPLPSKWQIVVGEPIPAPAQPVGIRARSEAARRLCVDVQDTVQQMIDQERGWREPPADQGPL
ncbi:lysophospholipid acyltransferase family protein [Streptomyces sp. NPDC002138]|uniref:lysophospholipid acyltransferase family protein n=1 Tax=Streptomyces sp. NPDC002138 TaxID=3154410 RepID=UPI00332ECB75